jgi:hypothetical protein
VSNSSDRESTAIELLGSYSIKTAGGIMLSRARLVLDGWWYANNQYLLFIADAPLSALNPNYPGRETESQRAGSSAKKHKESLPEYNQPPTAIG